ncbi:hypothetical protein E2C01_025571 [Portunus trituberculatus]|uniref:Uncharacterized protein n=1 Tax=Portunus trituberculatus TaxID=210409 RepID=A0A5B7EDP5_PORTR|nr:hypothetical protein [Portunus trituberculatus]
MPHDLGQALLFPHLGSARLLWIHLGTSLLCDGGLRGKDVTCDGGEILLEGSESDERGVIEGPLQGQFVQAGESLAHHRQAEVSIEAPVLSYSSFFLVLIPVLLLRLVSYTRHCRRSERHFLASHLRPGCMGGRWTQRKPWITLPVPRNGDDGVCRRHLPYCPSPSASQEWTHRADLRLMKKTVEVKQQPPVVHGGQRVEGQGERLI